MKSDDIVPLASARQPFEELQVYHAQEMPNVEQRRECLSLPFFASGKQISCDSNIKHKIFRSVSTTVLIRKSCNLRKLV